MDELDAKELAHLRQIIVGYKKELAEAEQILGRALGYPPYFPDFPDALQGEVCVGEHTVVTLAMEAADKLARYGEGN